MPRTVAEQATCPHSGPCRPIRTRAGSIPQNLAHRSARFWPCTATKAHQRQRAASAANDDTETMDDDTMMKRTVSAHLDVDINAETTLEFQIAVPPHPGAGVQESLSFELNGQPVHPLEISGLHGNRIHKFAAPIGNLQANYTATIVGQTDPAPVTDYDQVTYLWPSRYAEADKFYGFAATEFGEYV